MDAALVPADDLQGLGPDLQAQDLRAPPDLTPTAVAYVDKSSPGCETGDGSMARPFCKVQQGVDLVQTRGGGLVLVQGKGGTLGYLEQVRITGRGVTLRGEGGPTILYDPSLDPVIISSGAAVVVEDLRMSGGNRALRCSGDSEVLVRRSTLDQSASVTILTTAAVARYPTRIELLFETLAEVPSGPRPPYEVFDRVARKLRAESRASVWNGVLALHARVREWFEDRDLFHKIGFLVTDRVGLGDLLREAQAMPRAAFRAALDERIRGRLKLTLRELRDLTYHEHERSQRALFLMNVETARARRADARYPFYRHRDEAWTLEHIHPQKAEGMNKKEQWLAWLDEHQRGEPRRGLPLRSFRYLQQFC